VSLIHCTDLSAADWIVGSDLPWHRLVTLGPAGFAAYARLRFLPDPEYDGQSENDVQLDIDDPAYESRLLTAALGVLARHTTTPGDCYFCLWEGWGTVVGGQAVSVLGSHGAAPRVTPAFPASVLDGPKVEVPGRAFFLFRGPLSAAGDWGAADLWPGGPERDMPPPAFVWPADHRWCLTNDVDPHWAGIGATRTAVDELLADPRLDVVVTDPGEEQPHYL
jgi:hypothetical protein